MGKESAENGSTGWLARAFNAGLITNQTYSYVLAPYHNASLPATNETANQTLAKMSYLTLNGFDERDYIGNISWFTNFSSGWNMTLDQLRLVGEDEDESIMPGASFVNSSNPTVTLMFQTGYPYIGVPT